MTFDPECRVFLDTNFLVDILEATDERGCETIIEQVRGLPEGQTVIPLTCHVAIWEAFQIRKQERYMHHAVQELQWTYRRAYRSCREYGQVGLAQMRRIGDETDQEVAEGLHTMDVWPPAEASHEERRTRDIARLLIRGLKLDWPDAVICAHALAANCDVFVTNDGQMRSEARIEELRQASGELDQLTGSTSSIRFLDSSTLAQRGVRQTYMEVVGDKNQGLFVSQVTNFFGNNLVAEIEPRIEFGHDDHLHFIWRDGAVSAKAEQIGVDDTPADRAAVGAKTTVFTGATVPRGAHVYINELPDD